MSSQAAGGCPPVSKSTQRSPSFRKNRLRASFSCVSPSSHGEIVVVEEPSVPSEYVVGWRRDRRHSRSILRLSAFGDRQAAISKALALSCGYVPSTDPKRNRARDSKRSSVYMWERAFAGPRRPYASIEDAAADARHLAALFGVTPVTVSLGSSRLVSGSYFMPSRGIVLASSMLDRASLIHEMAHYLVWRMGIEEPSHGPAFAAALVAFHVLSATMPVETPLVLAEKYNLKINTDLLDGLLGFSFRKLAA
ncbi:SprT-like domain-containing protein [Pararhizobium sp. BT-229]|uniref:SprT-like domain-containing protein n=1 Tax=Pararhizobium sp. BT-229 TaxID=2986923 RepID=UPI0021F77DC7|nr:SprT-like domain-containing protein [Pararhizobium sp. BT-229]MCV9963603.1 SprT-like domain-containing protein [Pararhizobium sp. BT-229]